MDDSIKQAVYEVKRIALEDDARASFWRDMADADKSWSAADSVDDPTQLIADVFQYIGKFYAKCSVIDASDMLAMQKQYARREARFDSHVNIVAWCERAVNELISKRADDMEADNA